MAAASARKAAVLCALLSVVLVGLFSDWLLVLRGATFSARIELQEIPTKLAPLREAHMGDQVVVLQDFFTDSTSPVVVPAGSKGVVVDVDGAGDADILFAKLGREWVYSDKFWNLAVTIHAEAASKHESSAAASSEPGKARVEAPALAPGRPAEAAGAPSPERPAKAADAPSPETPAGLAKNQQAPVEAPAVAPGRPAEAAGAPSPKRPAEVAVSPAQIQQEAPDSVLGTTAFAAHPQPEKQEEVLPKKQSAPSPTASQVVPPAGPPLHADGQECGQQALELGDFPTPEDCEKEVLETTDCGRHFMFSAEHPDWKCRCCTDEGADGGPFSAAWSVFEVRTPRGAKKKEEVVAVAPASSVHSAKSETQKASQGQAKEKYVPKMHHKGQECDDQAFDFGYVTSPAKCDLLTAGKADCGESFMFSKLHPDWHCRCCSPTGADDGPPSPNWDVYKVQSPLTAPRKALPPTADVNPYLGLPVAEGPRPGWLMRDDALIVDGRADPARGGGVVILQAVLMDASHDWGKKLGDRPRWLRAILATNRHHARLHGHALIMRARPTQPQLTDWQIRQCGKKSQDKCTRENQRENYNWEKHLMLGDYLNSPQKFTHVIMMDADAAFVQPAHNTIGLMAEMLDKKEKDLFLTDEDWLKYGEGRINGGLILAKNTKFTQDLFKDTFDAHVSGPKALKHWRIGVHGVVCSSNEQICLNDLWKGGRGPLFSDHTMMVGGMVWNRGFQVGNEFDQPEVEILHFMGGGKSQAGKVLCDGKRDVTGEGPKGYGCKM